MLGASLMRLLLGCLVAGSLAVGAEAKPLVTSSEDNVHRICIARGESPARLVTACDAALAGLGLTQSQRVDLIVARGDAHLWQKSYDAAIVIVDRLLRIIHWNLAGIVLNEGCLRIVGKQFH